MNSLFAYGLYQESINLDSAAYYYKQAGELSGKLNYTKGILSYYSNYTYILNQKGQVSNGLELNKEALAFARKKGTDQNQADCLFNVGSSYNNLGNFDKALQYYLEAARIFERLNDKRTLVTVYDNIGGVYTNSKQYNKALDYHNKAYREALELEDNNGLAKVLINKGITEHLLRKNELAQNDLEYGLNLSISIHEPYLQSIAYKTLAEIFIQQNRFQKALTYARKAYQLGLEIKSNYAQSEALKSLTASFDALGMSDSTIHYGKMALNFGVENQYSNDISALYQFLAQAYEQKDDFEKALLYQKKFKTISDSVLNEEIAVKMQRIQNEFKEAKSENEILNLQSAKRKQQVIITGLVVGLLLIVSLMVLVSKAGKSRRKRIEQEIHNLKNAEDLKAAQIILQTQEEERLRIAKDLHDGLGGLLSGIKLTLQNSENGKLQKHEENALGQLDSAINEMRRISHSMMPEALVKFGLVDALTDVCKNLENSKQFLLSYQFFGFKKRLSSELETNLYRIVLELLNNAIKHSNANEIYLQMILQDDEIAVTIEDDGVGFEKEILHSSSGIGYRNIASRLKLINGTIDVQTEVKHGTTINIEIKL